MHVKRSAQTADAIYWHYSTLKDTGRSISPFRPLLSLSFFLPKYRKFSSINFFIIEARRECATCVSLLSDFKRVWRSVQSMRVHNYRNTRLSHNITKLEWKCVEKISEFTVFNALILLIWLLNGQEHALLVRFPLSHTRVCNFMRTIAVHRAKININNEKNNKKNKEKKLLRRDGIVVPISRTVFSLFLIILCVFFCPLLLLTRTFLLFCKDIYILLKL